jgi:hypothetical protein
VKLGGGLGVLVGAALLAPASATAATPLNPPVLTLASGNNQRDAGVVVQPDGSAVVSWHGNQNLDQSPVYTCRLPAAGTCSSILSTQVPSYTFSPVFPLVPDSSNPNDLYLFTGRSDSTYDLHSTDGAQTLGGPVKIGNLDASSGLQNAVVGPSFSISSVTQGERFEADPIDGSGAGSDVSVDLRGSSAFRWSSSVGMVDPTTPLVASIEETGPSATAIVYRHWTNTGSVNDAATWSPEKLWNPPGGQAGSLVSLQLLTGPKGLFAFFAQQTQHGQRYVVSRYDPVADSFGTPVPVASSAYEDDGAYESGIATEDPAGRLHVLWRAATNAQPVPNGYYYTVSQDGGKTFQTPTLVYPESNFPDQLGYNRHIAANENGSTVVTFGATGVYAIRLPATAGGGASGCHSTVSFGPLKALASSGCFTVSGSKYSTTGAVRIDGIDMQPAAGGGKLTIDTSAHTVGTTGPWTLRAGAVSLGTSKLSWKVPVGGGALQDTSSGGPVMLNASAGGQKILGMPVSGFVMPSFTGGVAHLPVNLKIPSPVGGFLGGPPTDDLDLTADNGSSIHLNKGQVKINLPEVSLGLASIKPFDVTYTSDPFVFTGELGIDLPVVGKIDGAWLFRNGQFIDATANYTPPSPGIPITGFVYLTRLGLHVHGGHSCGDQTSLNINGDLSAGPDVAGESLLGLTDAGATYHLSDSSCSEPAKFLISGDGRLVGIDALHVALTYVLPAKVTFGASGEIGGSALGLFLDLDGGLDVSSGQFYASGSAEAKVAGFDAASLNLIVGTVGFGGCVTLAPIPQFWKGSTDPIAAGFEYRWHGGLDLMVGDCSVDDLVPAEFIGGGSRAHATAAGPVPVAKFTVPKGGGKESIIVRGASGPPDVVLQGPQGQTITGPTSPNQELTTPQAVGLQLPSLKETSITLKDPAAGTWTVLNAGSGTIASVSFGHSVPPVSVHASVKRLRASRFELGYRDRPIKGQTIRFFQVGARTERLIGVARGALGTIRFSAGAGVAERRKVIAVVEQGGIPRAAPTVATFRAPDTLSPGRPGAVGLQRIRGGLRVSWRPAANATHYVVRVLLHDGRAPLLITGPRKRSVFIRNVPGIDSGKVLVAAQSSDGHLGRAVQARFRALPRKRPPHHCPPGRRCRR